MPTIKATLKMSCMVFQSSSLQICMLHLWVRGNMGSARTIRSVSILGVYRTPPEGC